MRTKHLLIAAAILASLAGCSSSGGEVKPDQIDSYQSAGLKPGETVQKATGGDVGPK